MSEVILGMGTMLALGMWAVLELTALVWVALIAYLIWVCARGPRRGNRE